MFTIAAFDLEHKTFIIYVAAFSIDSNNMIHPLRMVYLKADELLTKVPNRYTDFADVLLLKLVIELPKYIRINNHAIKLINDWQPSYNSIYSLEPIKLEIFKAYIENNLANGFIKPFKSTIRVFIYFNEKPNNSLKLYVDY